MRFWFDFLQQRKNRWPRGLLVGVALAFLVARLYGAAHFYSHSTQLDNLAAAGKHGTLQNGCELCIAAAKLDKSFSPPITLSFLLTLRYQWLAPQAAPDFIIGVAPHYAIRGPPNFDY